MNAPPSPAVYPRMNTDHQLDRLERLVTDAERLTADAVRDRNLRVARATRKLLARLAARLDAIVRGDQ